MREYARGAPSGLSVSVAGGGAAGRRSRRAIILLLRRLVLRRRQELGLLPRQSLRRGLGIPGTSPHGPLRDGLARAPASGPPAPPSRSPRSRRRPSPVPERSAAFLLRSRIAFITSSSSSSIPVFAAYLSSIPCSSAYSLSASRVMKSFRSSYFWSSKLDTRYSLAASTTVTATPSIPIATARLTSSVESQRRPPSPRTRTRPATRSGTAGTRAASRLCLLSTPSSGRDWSRHPRW